MRSLVGGILDAVAGSPAKPPVPYAPTRATFQGAVSAASTSPSQQQVAAMGSTGTLFSIIARITENLAQVGWHLYRTAKPGTPPEHRVEVTSHAALDLWNRPNAFFSRQEFVESFAQHLELTGEAWWLVSKSGNLPLELWPVRPDRMTPVPSTQKFLAGYTYRSPDGDKIPLDLDEVVFLRR
ncbi:MAG TPA: phage portal protein, partial [Kineosporiaceae bacterium]